MEKLKSQKDLIRENNRKVRLSNKKLEEVVAGERVKNTQGKTRPVDKPYEIWEGRVSIEGDILNMEWRVLKKWQIDDDKPFARWFCAVKSEATYGDWEYGDTYVEEIKKFGHKIFDEREVNNA